MADRLRILLIDDDASARRGLASLLARFDVVDAIDDVRAAIPSLRARPYDLVLCDVRSPRFDGAGLLTAAAVHAPGAVVVLMSAFASVDHVNAALRLGAYDFLLKPIEPQQIAAMLARVRERITLRRSVDSLRDALALRDAMTLLLTTGPTMTSVGVQLRRVAASDAPTLIVGDPGTGKVLAARAIHAMSTRAERPVVVIDCRGDPAHIAAQLFGLGAHATNHPTISNEGTLVLRSVTSLPNELRVRALRALDRAAAPRVIATSEGIPAVPSRLASRRHELLAWVRASEVVIPALRDRREDIPRLVEHFSAVAMGAGVAPRIAPDVMATLIDAPWHGNLPELEACVRHMVARAAAEGTVTREHLPEALAKHVRDRCALTEQVEAYERAVLRRALESVEGAVARAARELGVPERTLRRKMRQFGIAKENFRRRSRYKHLPIAVPRS